MRSLGILALVLLISGCVSGNIYLYVKDMHVTEETELKKSLTGSGLNVITAGTPLPSQMNSTTLICHSFVSNQVALDRIQTVLREHGIQVSEIYFGSNRYNHVYTEDNYGVYVVGNEKGSKQGDRRGASKEPAL